MNDIINIFKDFKKHIMSGVSYIIPGVAAGGLLMGIGILLGGNAGVPNAGTFAYFLFALGQLGINAMAPIGGGYIAFSIADKAGLIPGILVGMLAQSNGTGFIGGIVAGFVVGVVVTLLQKVSVPKNLRTMKDLIFVPALAMLVAGVIVEYVLGGIINTFTVWLTALISNMSTSSILLIAMLTSALNQLDYGVFISKAGTVPMAVLLGQTDPTTGLPPENALILLAATLCAQSIPPLVCFISTLISGRKKYEEEDIELGRTALVLSLCGITEGAIPFAMKDYLRTTLCCSLGASIAAGVAVAFKCKTLVMWSGPICTTGMTSFAMVLEFFVAMIVGGVVGGVLLSAIKKPLDKQEVKEDVEAKITDNEGSEVTIRF